MLRTGRLICGLVLSDLNDLALIHDDDLISQLDVLNDVRPQAVWPKRSEVSRGHASDSSRPGAGGFVQQQESW